MELTTEQKQTVADWVEGGSPLAEVQTRLQSELGISMTYMDVRFLVLDLNVELKDPEPEVVEPPEAAPEADAAELAVDGEGEALEADATALPFPEEPMPGSGSAAVEVDAIMRPGCLVSGTVVFGDGVKATWMLDQMGRLSLDAGDPTYQPSEADVADFQTALQTELGKKGF